MLIDHVGAIFFPEISALRVVGRLAFPIYCFLLSEGFFHTSSRTRYALRLLLFAVLSELPFDLAFGRMGNPFQKQNVYFTLLVGLLAVWGCEIVRRQFLLFCIPVAAAGCAAAWLLKSDYQIYGVLFILVFYFFHRNKALSLSGFLFANTGYALLAPSTIQYAGALALLPLGLYNGHRGPRCLKYAFYAFYPLHLLILYAFRLALP